MSLKHKNKICYFLICLLLFVFLSPTELAAKNQKRKKQSTRVKIQKPVVAEWQAEFRAKVENASFPEWMLAQITKDLEPFEEMGITLENIENTIKRFERGFVLCTIQDNLFSWSCYPQETMNDFRCKMLADGMSALVQSIPMPNVTFLVYVGEGFLGEGKNEAPVFTWCRHSELGNREVGLPDYEALSGNYNCLREVFLGSQYYPWEKKQNFAFWRGAPTGMGVVESEVIGRPRMNLVQASKLFPKFIDAKFSNFYPGQNMTLLKPFEGNSLSVTEHLRYKYQILVDGHVSAFSRAYWELFSNCVIFKHESPWYQWFYSQLQPYVNYIPYRADTSDLVKQIMWAMEHDEEAHQISKNANEFANNNLRHSDIMLYVYLLLMKYAQLQRF